MIVQADRSPDRTYIQSIERHRGNEEWVLIALDEIVEDCRETFYRSDWSAWPVQLLLFIPRMESPVVCARSDGMVSSFACKREVFDCITRFGDNAGVAHMCYCISRRAMADAGSGGILIRQVPRPTPLPSRTLDPGDRAVVVAHRGHPRDLEGCLSHVSTAMPGHTNVAVAFDQQVKAAERLLMKKFPRVSFFAMEPHPVGPYMTLFTLLEHIKAQQWVLQDSDDVPSVDRFYRIAQKLENTRLDIVGCHELRVDDISQRVYAVRFPLQVNQAYQRGAGHAMLHPTCAMNRTTYQRIGGFSTNKRFGLDYQFQLRASLTARMGNIDDFLYIRRTHAQCLTRDPQTGMQSEQRLTLAHQWQDDFFRVLLGVISIEQSSLRVQRSDIQGALRPLGTEGKE